VHRSAEPVVREKVLYRAVLPTRCRQPVGELQRLLGHPLNRKFGQQRSTGAGDSHP